MSFTTCLLVTIGGAIGSLARYALSVAALPISQSLPWGTIGINILGSFVIGLFGTLTLANGRFPVSEEARILVMVGMCGGFTTFSSFSLQTLNLMNDGEWLYATGNIAGSVILCMLFVWLGAISATALNQLKGT